MNAFGILVLVFFPLAIFLRKWSILLIYATCAMIQQCLALCHILLICGVIGDFDPLFVGESISSHQDGGWRLLWTSLHVSNLFLNVFSATLLLITAQAGLHHRRLLPSALRLAETYVEPASYLPSPPKLHTHKEARLSGATIINSNVNFAVDLEHLQRRSLGSSFHQTPTERAWEKELHAKRLGHPWHKTSLSLAFPHSCLTCDRRAGPTQAHRSYAHHLRQPRRKALGELPGLLSIICQNQSLACLVLIRRMSQTDTHARTETPTGNPSSASLRDRPVVSSTQRSVRSMRCSAAVMNN